MVSSPFPIAGRTLLAGQARTGADSSSDGPPVPGSSGSDPSAGGAPATSLRRRQGGRGASGTSFQRARPANPTRPNSVKRVPAQSTGVRPKCSSTVVSVGTTTIRLGLARQGPLAPFTCQFGKYDVLTSTGTPGSETSNFT